MPFRKTQLLRSGAAPDDFTPSAKKHSLVPVPLTSPAKEQPDASQFSDIQRLRSALHHPRDQKPIFSAGMFMQKVNYIHLNPVRAELVSRAIDYRWSSARIWQRCPLEDEPFLVDIDRINWRHSRQ